MPKTILLVLCSLLLVPAAHGQRQFTEYHPSITSMQVAPMRSAPRSLHVLSQPLGFLDRNKTKIILLAAGLALAVNELDAPIDRKYALDKNAKPAQLLQSFGRIGNFYDSSTTYYYVCGITASAFAYGTIFHDAKATKTVKLMVKAYVVSSIISSAIKLTIGRKRPYTNAGPTVFLPFRFGIRASERSFPSGHTTTIFSLMTVLAKQYPKPWVQIPAYALAASVGFQRMLYRKHWFSDVVVGGAIGYFVGNAMVNHSRKQRPSRVNFQPVVEDNRLGIVLTF